MSGLLERINEPYDIKGLTEEELIELCGEIRSYLIDVVTETGGHLSSNLGVVEMTVALHYVFNSPYDQFVWDVGHQSYIHKILTGRREALKTIRQYGGISGFTKRNESEHDVFDVGHSSTSISAALGFAEARELKKESNAVVAIIGDGALTAGMAYEALNNSANLKSNFIVILNDNQMSIAPNVGGMAQYLDSIRTGRAYNVLKTDVHKVLDRVPVVGKSLTKAVRDLRDGVKQVVIPGMFFEEIGYKYLGPIDGHNIEQVITVLRQARKIKGPVLIHMKTVKGKGYHVAEEDPSKYHGVKPMCKEALLAVDERNKVKQMPSYGELMGERLINYVRKGEAIAGISAAMPAGTGLTKFAKKCPAQFFDVGIAEQHAVTFAAGLGLKGIKPFVAIYSTFIQRAYDQVLHDVCIQKVPVVLLLDRAGMVGEDGETHHGVYDYALLNHMPNMTIMAPRDGKMFLKMLDYSLKYTRGPIAIRYPKGPAPVIDCAECPEVIHGKGTVLKSGNAIAILAVGSMVEVALEVAKELDVTVADGVFIKPFDYQLVNQLAATHKGIIVVEEGCKIGGYGSLISQYVSDEHLDVRVHSVGIDDTFIQHGTRTELLNEVGLNKEGLVKVIKKMETIWQ